MKSTVIKTIGVNIGVLLLLGAVAAPIATAERNHMIDGAERAFELSGVAATSAR